MAKDTGSKKNSRKKLLEAARKHLDALQAVGLSSATLNKFETALKGVEGKSSGPNAAAQTLIQDIRREVAEVQAAIRKEFPNNTSFQAIFKAAEPVPQDPRGVLAIGRLIAKEAPDYA